MAGLVAYQITRRIEPLHAEPNDWILLRPDRRPADHTVILCQYRGEVIVGVYRMLGDTAALQPFEVSVPQPIDKNDDFRLLGSIVAIRKGPQFPELT